MIKGTVEYSSNNSGGSWWLDDEDWKALEAAGWEVDWVKDGHGIFNDGERFLGALATKARKHNTTMRQAIAEWEDITGERANDLGCSCCGTPHWFILTNDKGEYDDYSPEYPTQGNKYGEW